MHALIVWWAGLSWSHAALVLGCIALAAAALLLWSLTPRDAGRREDDGGPWPLVDYSAQYRAKAAWLGERWLLARPVNRISRRDTWMVMR